MTTEPAAVPAPRDQASRYLTAVALGGDPDPATVAVHPDPYADTGPGPQLDCTCTWTPDRASAPQATAAVVAAVLNAIRRPVPRLSCRPPHADAVRLAGFMRCHPSWSAFWDPRYGLWRAAEDDPGSVLYAETPDAAAVITYITGCSRTTVRRPGRGPRPAPGRPADAQFHAERAKFHASPPATRNPGLAPFPPSALAKRALP